MSLLDSNFIEIDIFYRYVNSDNGKRLAIVDEEKGREMLKSGDDKSKNVEVLKTKWCLLTWQEQNDVMNLASQSVNPQTGDRQFNFLAYRDAVVKKCLKEWNLTINEKPIPVTKEAIDKLPGLIVSSLYQKFEKFVDYSDQEMGN